MSWVNRWGTINLFGPGEEDDSDNGILFLGYYLALNGSMNAKFNWALFFKEPGLQMRSPIRPFDSNSWDNDIGMCYVSSPAARTIAEYGKAHHWYFNVDVKANKFSWSLVRQPSQQYVILKAAGMKTNPIQWVWFISSVIVASFHGEKRTSELLCQWLSNRIVLWRCSFVTRKVIRWFENRIARKFGSWASVFDKYFSPSNPSHPIIVLANEYFKKNVS